MATSIVTNTVIAAELAKSSLDAATKRTFGDHLKKCDGTPCVCNEFEAFRTQLGFDANPWGMIFSNIFKEEKYLKHLVNFEKIRIDTTGIFNTMIEDLIKHCSYTGFDGIVLIKQLMNNFDTAVRADYLRGDDVIISKTRCFLTDMSLLIILHFLRGNNVSNMMLKMPSPYKEYLADSKVTYGILNKVSDTAIIQGQIPTTMSRIAGSLSFLSITMIPRVRGAGVISLESLGIKLEALHFLVFPSCNSSIPKEFIASFKWVCLYANILISDKVGKVNVENCMTFVKAALTSNWPNNNLRITAFRKMDLVDDKSDLIDIYEIDLKTASAFCRGKITAEYPTVNITPFNTLN